LDATKETCDALAKTNDKIRVIHFGWNRGYGKAACEGLARCMQDDCDFAVCLHSDGQYPPESIVDFVDKMGCESIDVLQGSRIASGTALSGGMPMYKYIANRILTFFENIVFNLSMTDYHSGMLFYGRKALDIIPFYCLSPSFDFDLEVIACAKSKNLTIREMPIPTRYAGEISYLNPITYGLRVLLVMGNFILRKYENV